MADSIVQPGILTPSSAQPLVTVITGSGTYTKLATSTVIEVMTVGGGGGGGFGGTYTATLGGSGGGGGAGASPTYVGGNGGAGAPGVVIVMEW